MPGVPDVIGVIGIEGVIGVVGLIGVVGVVGVIVAAGVGTLAALVWFPQAADALAQRHRLPAPPSWTSLWAVMRQRPIVWMMVAGGSAAIAFRFAAAPADAVVVVIVLACAVLSAMVDVRCHRLPDAITAPLWAVMWPVMVAVALLGGDPLRIRSALIAGLVAAAVLGTGWLMGMGFGDVKLGALLALVAGWLAAHPITAIGAALGLVLVATCIAVVASVGRIVVQQLAALGPWRRPLVVNRGGRWFAFGPHLVAAAMVVMVAGGPGLGG